MGSSQSLESLSSSEFNVVHEACEEFEKGLQRGERVSIEWQVSTVPENVREPLLMELLFIEIEWRRARREDPKLDDYLLRFPEQNQELNRLFQTVSTQQPLRFDDPHRDLATVALESTAALDSSRTSPDLPATIGRYQIERILGAGAFGLVFKALDPVLGRSVAIKVPHPEVIQRAGIVEAYVKEARALANLSHSNIVPIHDIGTNADYPCFFVLKYIEGETLATQLKQGALKPKLAAEYMASIAQALHCAHTQGLTHRDVKPTNILIDTAGVPYLMDFGLALTDEAVGTGPKYAGTPAYMSPEQARGEGHRVDGRSDVFSLGTVLYELLTGQRPFRGDTQIDLLHRVATSEPRPLHQYDATIPKELELICQRAMAKNTIDRYASASEMAQELREYLAGSSGEHGSAPPGPINSDALVLANHHHASSRYASDSRLIRIVPKGLRAFDEHDAYFFMELLPGVRDLHGVPESLRFWRSKIEQPDAAQTFPVGMLYGPSGSGKSSLVKAGLLPMLSPKVKVVYVEASADQTEVAILKRLRQQNPELPNDLTLLQSLTSIRTKNCLRESDKVLLVVDQFEQWLHANSDLDHAELVQALRQCDGSNLQCLLLVRDDFWMASTRFMHALEVRLLDGVNSRSIDLLPARHARRILAAIGQAYGTIPDSPAEITDEQSHFLDKAVEMLTQNNTVVCVHLALFAYMIRHRAWTTENIDLSAGAAGIGTAFLEETFCSPSSPPVHRYHQTAARAVLRTLLPDAGTDIRGQMQACETLREAADCSESQFQELLQILDLELRLVTPTERESIATTDQASSTSSRYYQLTHDFMVPALRRWLTEKQLETRRGRAELRLEQRAALWQRKPENSLLPSLFEYVNMRWWTNKRTWTEPERKLMQRTFRRLVAHSGAVFLGICLCIGAVLFALSTAQQRNVAQRTATAVDAARLARAEVVPQAIADLEQLPRAIVVEKLSRRFDEVDDNRQKLGLAFALAYFNQDASQFIVSMIRESTSGESLNFQQALNFSQAKSLAALSQAYNRADTANQPRQMARLASVALQLGDASLARDMCQAVDKPGLQSIFLAEFPNWQGNTRAILKESSADDPTWRSALALAMGSIDPSRLDAPTRQDWSEVLQKWFLHELDNSTHSAAGWALKQWQVEQPALSASKHLVRGDWHVNHTQLTMCKINAGSFMRTDTLYDASIVQKVSVTYDYLLSDREITVKVFSKFVNDTDYPAAEKPRDWSNEFSAFSPTEMHPIQNVSWYDCVLFCNWLSRREGVPVCYERTGKEDQTERRGLEEWRLIPDAGGYRLPTEAEWELACRGGTSTKYYFGEDESLLERYAVFATSQPLPCGSKLPNALGLFDMAGNVYEWCHDWSGPYGISESVIDPANINERGMRAKRGGAFLTVANPCSSGDRNRAGPWGKMNFVGFRVARTLPIKQ